MIKSGFLRFKVRFYLFFFALAGLWGGTQMLYTRLRNSAPAPFTVENFVRDRPGAKWLTLSGGVLDLSKSSCHWTLAGVDEVYAPLRTPVDHGPAIVVLVASKDPATIELAQKLDELETRAAKDAFIAAHRIELQPRRTITGLVRSGIDWKPDDVDYLRRQHPALTSDFVLIDEDKEPDLYLAVFVLAVGIGSAVWFGITFRQRPASPPPLPGISTRPPSLPGGPPPVPGSS